MSNPLWKAVQRADDHAQAHGWSKAMSDHIAFALLVYTGLNIVLTVGAIKGALQGSILPYFSLVVLVGAIIPACRSLEKRWERLDASSFDEAVLRASFRRDRVLVWVAAIVLPVALTLLFKAFAAVV